jgi:hypothetical protein
MRIYRAGESWYETPGAHHAEGDRRPRSVIRMTARAVVPTWAATHCGKSTLWMSLAVE